MLEHIRVGFAMCGSFCTFSKVFIQLEQLCRSGAEVTPIVSPAVFATDSRFGNAQDFLRKMEELCGRPVVSTLAGAEPFGPKGLLDVLIIAPCTGNTLGKLANGISDTPVTLAAKAHLRNQRPIVVAVSTNDALSGSAANIGKLMNTKYYYFVPLSQDDPEKKPASAVAHFDLLIPTAEAALDGRQLQPVWR